MKNIQTIATLAIGTLLGTYASASETVIHGIDGSQLSPEQASEHIAQFEAKPAYKRLETGTDFDAFIDEIERDGMASRSFGINLATDALRLSESEPESIRTLATVRIHNTRTLAEQLRVTMLNYSRIADHVYVDCHKGKYSITVSVSTTFGSGVLGL